MGAVVETGIEVLRADGFAALRGKRVGLLSNPSGVDAQMNSTVDILRGAPGVELVALFGAEHGVLAAAGDGEHVASAIEPRTGLIAHSLYGDTLRPTAAMLDGLDAVVCDIQDIGARFYTYVWTLSHILEAAGEHGVAVVVLDRPNPLGGVRIDGGGLVPACASLVGRYDIPIQHGMTLGELARLLNGVWNPSPAELTVIACRGWRREMTWQATGLPFVPPSPAMGHVSTAQHYPGACLLEGTTLSEGRGTVLPFEVVGAPYIDPHGLAEALNALDLPGVRWRAHTFRPTASKYAGQTCHGVQAHITEPAAYRPALAWLHVIHTVRHRYPDDFGWTPPYETGAGATLRHFDRLVGDPAVREQIDAGVPVAEITAGWGAVRVAFAGQCAPYRLY